MNDDVKTLFIFIGYFLLGIALFIFVLLFANYSETVNRLQGEAISRGYAEFVYEDSCLKFQWKNPPVEKPEK